MLATLRTRIRSRLCAGAHDVTDAVADRPALVLAAHPDDETLGCGATILRKAAAGTPVTVLVVSDGRYSHRSACLTPQRLAGIRRREMLDAVQRLGLDRQALRWGGFIDGTLAEREDELAELIADTLADVQPTEVYVNGAFEPHPDHAALGRAARRALRDMAPAVRLLEYPIWLWAQWPLPGRDRISAMIAAAKVLSLNANVTKVRVGEYRVAKQHALDAHGSQLRRPDGLPADEDWWTIPRVLCGDDAELFLPWSSLGTWLDSAVAAIRMRRTSTTGPARNA